MSDHVFHDGEREIQTRLGLGDRVAQFAAQVVRPYMPQQHRDFFQQLPFVVMAARDQQARPWITLLAGNPGFIRSATDTTLDLNSGLHPGDPLAAALDDGADVGLLGIELESRRRNRLNGVLHRNADGSLQVRTRQSFGNCPQYITQRDWIPAPSSRPPATSQQTSSLTPSQSAWIAQADTFFIGSGYETPASGAASGMDASHRGGAAGFVEVTDQATLLFPDYSGNNHFNTLGNLIKDPRVALVFVDFARGHLLQLTGTARIDWDSAAIAQRPGAARLVQVDIEAVVEQRNALPIRWKAPATEPLKLQVTKRVYESDSITSFILEGANAAELPPFIPGQHLPVAVEIATTTHRRTYSLSAAPDRNQYRISVKREPQGVVSRALHAQLQVGDHLTAGAPAGDFKLLAKPGPITLISAGVGITPVLSMLHQLGR
ncbi:MAG: pyridoxamine 5'-phosphate oxidase family protein, partial [Pseudomonadales bacterium]